MLAARIEQISTRKQAPSLEFVVDPFSALLEAFKETPQRVPEPLRTELQLIWNVTEEQFPGALSILMNSKPTSPFDGTEQACIEATSFIKDQDTFRKFERDIISSGNLLQAEWNSMLTESTSIMCDLTGIDFSQKQIRVRVLHPAIPAGMARIDKSEIHWRYTGDEYPEYKPDPYFPFYNTVYLWHERLHFELSTPDLEHAVIQFATDNELRVQLAGGTYPPFVGHSSSNYNLTGRMNKYYPDWQEYIKQPAPRDIYAFCSLIRERHGE